MKTRLQHIAITNFKAFRQFELDLDGKHLLVYGGNGTGKSSLYWALHCFLQSARKSEESVAKYFDPDNPQNLLNIHEDPATVPGEIAMTLREMATKTDTVLRINGAIHGTRNEPTILRSDLASDFVTYRFFFGFSHFRNSERFNLWPLFEKEILPFCVDTGGKNPLECWDAIKDRIPNPWRERGISGAYNYDAYRARVETFKTLLPGIVNRISVEAQRFYDEFFAGSDQRPVTIKLGLTSNASYPVENRERNELGPPDIELAIQIDGKTVHRPQAFLNEAKLTQLALSVRFAASLVNLNDSPNVSHLKLLVLDDLLVSLDLSNRMKVVEILMSQTFEPYQKIILTHDLGLYQEVKRWIGSSHPEWLFQKMEGTSVSGPKLIPRKSDLEWAQHYLENDQLEECGNRLRKCVEANLESFLTAARQRRGLAPVYDREEFSSLANRLGEAKGILEQAEGSHLARLLQQELSVEHLQIVLADEGIDHTKIEAPTDAEKGRLVGKLIAAKTNLHDAVLEALSDASRKRQTALKLMEDVTNIKDRILNPASHAGITPLYSKEAQDAVKIIQDLDVALVAALATLDQEEMQP